MNDSGAELDETIISGLENSSDLSTSQKPQHLALSGDKDAAQ